MADPPYGSEGNPVRLDLWKRIVEVSWGGGWSVLTLDTPEPGLPSFSRGYFPIFPGEVYDPTVELYVAEQDPPGIDKFNWALLIEPTGGAPYDLGIELYHDETPGRDKLLVWSFQDSATDEAAIADCIRITGDADRCTADLTGSLARSHSEFRSAFGPSYDYDETGNSFIVMDMLNLVDSSGLDPTLVGQKDYPFPPREIWADDRRMAALPEGRDRIYALKYEPADPGVSKRKLVRWSWLLNTVGAFREDNGVMEITQSAGHDEKLGSYMNKYTLDKYSKDVKFRVENGKFVEVPPAEGQPSKLKATIVKEVPYDQLGLVLKVSKGGFVE